MRQPSRAPSALSRTSVSMGAEVRRASGPQVIRPQVIRDGRDAGVALFSVFSDVYRERGNATSPCRGLFAAQTRIISSRLQPIVVLREPCPGLEWIDGDGDAEHHTRSRRSGFLLSVPPRGRPPWRSNSRNSLLSLRSTRSRVKWALTLFSRGRHGISGTKLVSCVRRGLVTQLSLVDTPPGKNDRIHR